MQELINYLKSNDINFTSYNNKSIEVKADLEDSHTFSEIVKKNSLRCKYSLGYFEITT